VNWIETQFPSLIPQLAPVLSPVEAARDELSLRAAAVVAACPSQHTALEPGSLPGRLRVVSPARFYAEVRAEVSAPAAARGKPADGLAAGPQVPAAASANLDHERVLRSAGALLRITGIHHVQRALEKAEAGALPGIETLELYVCDEGCWGSPLLPEDPFVARHRAAGIAVSRAPAAPRPRPYLARPGQRLDADMAGAIRKLSAIDELARRLPGRNCRVCGAPSCAALAEDIVLGRHPGPGCPLEEKP
jgi:hypothetical protein